jgi:DNA-binding transcriptional LysR family regulator
VLEYLNRLELPWRITYTSSSYSGITAAVRAGLGVTVLAESTVPDGVRALSERDGFPEMGHLDVRLHTPQNPSEAVLRLADYIASRL